MSLKQSLAKGTKEAKEKSDWSESDQFSVPPFSFAPFAAGARLTGG